MFYSLIGIPFRVLGPSLSSGNAAVDSIVDLSRVNSTVQEAMTTAVEANNTLEMVVTFANQLMTENITGRANILLNNTGAHYQDILLLNSTIARKHHYSYIGHIHSRSSSSLQSCLQGTALLRVPSV